MLVLPALKSSKKMIRHRAVIAKVLGLAFALPFSYQAHAVPLELSFSGTVGSSSVWPSGAAQPLVGATFNATFFIETEGLVRYQESTSDYEQIQYLGDRSLMGASLSIGGVDVDLSPYGQTNDGAITFVDSTETGFPFVNTPDLLSISVFSSSFPLVRPPPDGTYFGRQLIFDNVNWAQLDPFSNGQSDFIDFATRIYDPEILLTHALMTSTLSLYDTTVVCANLICSNTSMSTLTFTVDEIERRVTAVPEPGTFALFSLAVLGVGLGGRRHRVGHIGHPPSCSPIA